MEGDADDQSSDEERESRPDGAPADPDGEGSDEGPELQEGQQIHQTVPAHRKRADGKGDGVELGVEEHLGKEWARITRL